MNDHLLLVQTCVGGDGDLVVPDELVHLHLYLLELLGRQWRHSRPRYAGLQLLSVSRRSLQAQFVVARGRGKRPVLLLLCEDLLNDVIVHGVAGDQRL